jgi:hypothetical protein
VEERRTDGTTCVEEKERCGRDEWHDGEDERDRGCVACKEQRDGVVGGNETLAIFYRKER